MAAALSDYVPTFSLPDQLAGQSVLLVGGQGEVGQVVGGTPRDPGPDQASPVLVQLRLKCCPLH